MEKEDYIVILKKRLREKAKQFSKITCKPVAGVNNHAQVLVLGPMPAAPERPEETKEITLQKKRKKS